MNGFYYALDIIKDQLELDNDVNVVNTGIIEDVLLKKKDIYPYSHILVNNATLNGSTWTVSYSVICMDIVDISKEQTTDIFRGQNNVQDVLNTQFVVINRVLEVLRRGENTHLYQLDGSPNCEPFEDRFEHGVAGWTVTFDLLIPNDMTVCATDVTPVKLCPDFNYTITDADSTVLYTGDILSGDSLVQVISNATVTNSLTTVLATILAQGTVELADVNNIDSDGSTVPTPAGVAFTCTPVAPCADATLTLNTGAFLTVASGSTTDVSLVDQNDTDIVPISVIGSVIKVDIPSGGGGSNGRTLTKTGQIVKYADYDDGDLQEGIDRLTLPWLNVFGNNKRFSDTSGLDTYLANNIVLDHTTDNGATILGYYKDFGSLPADNWVNSLDYCRNTFSEGGFTGWHCANEVELFNIKRYASVGWFNYPPFNVPDGSFFWTSTTHPQNTLNAIYSNYGIYNLDSFDKTSTVIKPVPCRYFTYAELGL
jgi:hypothetical protein